MVWIFDANCLPAVDGLVATFFDLWRVRIGVYDRTVGRSHTNHSHPPKQTHRRPHQTLHYETLTIRVEELVD